MSWAPEIKLLSLAAGALVVALAGNALQGYVYLQQRDELTVARTKLDQAGGDTALARAAAEACSGSVEGLATSAAVLASQLTAERDAAAIHAGRLYAAADKILRTPPAVPGDACASARALVADVLQSRDRKGGQ
ncbi:MAG: hypothetical protein LBJ15_04480 [Comamonas sp.]|jgi:hypothetical protein|uniref:hypothetical protein n=1 Tax=Comamonas sp. TaxID=34028 RepID=UPI0028258E0D|nr:hypothetical protein [Comamonas sp.]MDR0213244.1 hypothetical protein [Comamonas sp.]